MKRRVLYFTSCILLSAGSIAAEAASLPALPTFTVPRAPVYTPPPKPVLPAPPKIMSASDFFALVKKK